MATPGHTQETGYWDQWNTAHRNLSFQQTTDSARTGMLALQEIARLNLDRPAILEVGCGTGWVAEQIHGEGRYVGIDLSPAAIQIAQQRLPSKEFVADDFQSWQPDRASFDVIVMVDTIAYFRDQDVAVAHAWSLLKEGGWLVITTVNPFVYSRMHSVGPPGPGQVRKWLSRSALHGLLRNAGFKIDHSYTVFPAGAKGILRIVNSQKIAKLLFGGEFPGWVTRLKEKLQLGQYRVAVAQRPRSS